MNEASRQRYEAVLLPLATQSEFDRADVPQWVSETSASFVTRTLNQVVQAGLMAKSKRGPDWHYSWSADDPVVHVQQWIQDRINGDQVKRAPSEQRPREQLLENGAASLSDAQLLAILIRVGVVGESATTGGTKLANAHQGELQQLRSYSLPEMRRFSRAITRASYCQIMAGIELGRRVAIAEHEHLPEQARITSTAEAIRYCARRFSMLASDAVQEEFHIVCLDIKHKPIGTHQITVGTLDASLVHPREVFRPAIRDAAAAVLLVHNHPSGDPTPSREDQTVTDRLSEAGKLIGIHVVDHIIVARQRCQSLREFKR
ncbi:MAG: DNA repair protein RadC [Planctomycetota bacterium]